MNESKNIIPHILQLLTVEKTAEAFIRLKENLKEKPSAYKEFNYLKSNFDINNKLYEKGRIERDEFLEIKARLLASISQLVKQITPSSRHTPYLIDPNIQESNFEEIIHKKITDSELTIKDLKKICLNLISKDELEVIFLLLGKSFLVREVPRSLDILALYENQFTRNEKKSKKGIITTEEYEVGRRKVINNLIIFIHNIRTT